MRRVRGLALATAIGALLAPVGIARAAALPLTGESLTGFGSSFTTNCSGVATYTETYQSSGTAAGPYPGTYTEQGSATVHNGRVTAFSASFTIVSGTTTITGTKSLSTGGTGICSSFGTVSWNTAASYSASIQTPTGTTPDSGVSQVQGGSGGFLTETFVSMPCDPNAQGGQDQGGNDQGC